MNKSLIDEAAELNEEKKKIEAKLTTIKNKIKSSGEGSYEGAKFKAIVTTRTTRTLNQEKALEAVKRIGAKWLLKEVVDEKKLEESLASGEIDASEFVGCVDTKTTTAINFKALMG